MSRGYVYRPTYHYKGEKRRSNVWWVGFSVNGEKQQESAKTEDKEEAQKFLTRRLRELDLLGPRRQDLDKIEYEKLAERIRRDYERNDRRSDIEKRLKHLDFFFGGRRVTEIRDDLVEAYVDFRLDDGAANATVNRELAALRRMFTLGDRANLVIPDRVPDLASHMLEENNVRKGFWTEDEFRDLLDALPERLRPLVEFAYVTGWRRGELLSRDWKHVDWEHNSLRLEPGESKSKEGREFPLTEHLRDVLERQLERKQETEEKHGCKVEALFFYYEPSRIGLPAGRRIKSFRRSWNTAVEAVGCPDRIFHSFRRTAIRNLVRSGVSEKIAMKLTGHKTRSVFDRYDIVTGSDLREAVGKLSSRRSRLGTGKDDRSSGEGEQEQTQVEQ